MKMEDKQRIVEVSIIVPVYNAERFIDRCVHGILAQTYTDFELILVDDGSKDESGRLCEAHAVQDARIQVIHQHNQGAAAARNAGLDAAKGRYVMFCDADDVVSPMWVERLLSLAKNDHLIQPIGAYCAEEPQIGTAKELKVISQNVYDRSAYYAFNESGIAGYLCNALYRLDVIREHGLRLRSRKGEGDYNEDLIFALSYASQMDGFVYTGYTDYMYDRREGSLSTSYQAFYFAKYEEKYRIWQEFIADYGSLDDKKRLSTMMLYHFLQAMQMECDQAGLWNFPQAYRRFANIVLSQSMQRCVKHADSSKENPRLVNLIGKRNTIALWLIYLLQRVKRRFRL